MRLTPTQLMLDNEASCSIANARWYVEHLANHIRFMIGVVRLQDPIEDHKFIKKFKKYIRSSWETRRRMQRRLREETNRDGTLPAGDQA